ncbi:transcriptional regulator family: Fungal Specific TF [Aspergillus niger]|nr:transcriptional regulator family: Fungal Specific TF [Aspergillus niger]KAI2840879.1 transcriptional regulator family: Fungal Specific TF [Aspergillus niger]KAI2841850.1 transcriptional regulator family: Fungal Specific TF [Aspergillus niger]KAI2862379.1 transcriptional regulator family: Fungal Specific TF [Aspergillus niger]KAI2882119.1 transcriptional regulator family: Fungal Specific TF [Aspergillus niger]
MPPKTYWCQAPGCKASYQRKEHLRRHEAQHTQHQLRQCTACTQKFRRSDTLRRHMQNVHGVNDMPDSKHACAHCRKQKSRCQGGPPCNKCLRRGIHCSLERRAEPHPADPPDPPRMLQPPPAQPETDDSDQESHYIGTYFNVFHPRWPFVHQGSFGNHEAPLLVKSMLVLGLWMSKQRKAQSKAIELHNVLGLAIRQQTDAWDASIADATSNCKWPISTYQAILLHIIFAGLYRGGGELDLDLKPSLAPADADLLERLVYIAWVFMDKDEGKIMPGTTSGRLRACDLQFPPPKNTPLWNAVTKDEWESAATADMDRHGIYDPLPQEWISNSADIVELVVTGFPLD